MSFLLTTVLSESLAWAMVREGVSFPELRGSFYLALGASLLLLGDSSDSSE